MKRSCLNQGCGLEWFFLKLLICFGVFYSGMERYATPSPGYLTLKEAIALGLQESLPASHLALEKQRLHLKELKLEEGKRQQQVTSSILGSRNEIGDARDLEASAQQTRQLILSYQENYENGFLWKITNTQRLTTPIDGEADDEEVLFQKILLGLSLPIYGTAADKTRLLNQKVNLSLDNEWRTWEQDNIVLQTQIAHLFLAYLMSHEHAKSAEEKLALVQQKLARSQSIKSQLSPLKLRQLELDLHQARVEQLNHHQALNQNRQQLALWIGNAASQRTPRLGSLLQLPQTEMELKELYLQNSIALQQLKNQLQIKRKELQISQLALQPNITLGGNIGQSRTNEREGSNRSVYVTLSYHFGGGQSQQSALEQHAFNQLTLELERQQQMLALQAQTDFLKLQSLQALIRIHRQQQELAEQEQKLAEESFRIGQSTQDRLQAAQVKLIQRRLAFLQAQIDYWKHVFRMMEQIQINALSLLE